MASFIDLPPTRAEISRHAKEMFTQYDE